jgi:hypothetical protein
VTPLGRRARLVRQGDFHRSCEALRVEHRPAVRRTAIFTDSFVLRDESAIYRKVVTMENTPSSAKGPLGRLRAWLRGDRFMVDWRPPTPAVAEPAAAPAPITDAQSPRKEN